MSTDTYKQCLESEYHLDREAVEFIIHIYELGGKAAVEDAHRAWDAIPAKVKGVIEFLREHGMEDKLKKFLEKVFGAATAALLAAMVVGLGVGAVLAALVAGTSCLPKLDD